MGPGRDMIGAQYQLNSSGGKHIFPLASDGDLKKTPQYEHDLSTWRQIIERYKHSVFNLEVAQHAAPLYGNVHVNSGY